MLAELGEVGFGSDPQWFAPHFEFRFPLVGELAVSGISMSLRNALEPWHVMGEDGTAGGTVRYVDSSLERLEVKVSGLVDNRHAITVNGQPLPLQATGRVGEFVAGVRFRAWQPPSALHPTIASHAPLTFDIVDRWHARSLGGCRYHVAHPGGRNYDTLPVNAYEAESRRLARFFRHGHSPGRMELAPPCASLEFPATLDLRRAGQCFWGSCGSPAIRGCVGVTSVALPTPRHWHCASRVPLPGTIKPVAQRSADILQASPVRPKTDISMTAQLDRLLFTQGGLCFFCRRLLPKADASVDHLVASANGGTNDEISAAISDAPPCWPRHLVHHLLCRRPEPQ